MMHHKPLVYFGATDRQMESFLDAEAFRRALVYGVLFHGDQVIPDIFLWISNRLAEFATIDPCAQAFLEACVRNAAIVPSFQQTLTEIFEKTSNRYDVKGFKEFILTLTILPIVFNKRFVANGYNTVCGQRIRLA